MQTVISSSSTTDQTVSHISPDKDLLKEEYFCLQSMVEAFDEKSLTIKAWNVSLVAALAGTSAFTTEYEILLFAALTSAMFWLVDAAWKTFQQAHYARMKAIEAYFRDGDTPIDNLQIASSWSESYKQAKLATLIKVMIWHHVFLPHGLLSLALVCGYIYLAY